MPLQHIGLLFALSYLGGNAWKIINWSSFLPFCIITFHIRWGECNEISNWLTYLPYEINTSPFTSHEKCMGFFHNWVSWECGDLREFLKSKVLSLRVFEDDDHKRACAILNANEIVACKKPMSEQALISEWLNSIQNSMRGLNGASTTRSSKAAAGYLVSSPHLHYKR